MAAPTQINRPFRVKTSLGDDALLVASFVGVERFRLSVSCCGCSLPIPTWTPGCCRKSDSFGQ